MKKIIHKAETANRKRIIYPFNLEKILTRAASSIQFVEGFENRGSVKRVYNMDNITLVYEYSPGLGMMPNVSSEITLYGKREDRNELKSKLLRKLEV